MSDFSGDELFAHQDSANPPVRRKRDNHNELERKRRRHQREVLYQLRDVVPTLTSSRASSVAIMKKSKEYIDNLHVHIRVLEAENRRLREQMNMLPSSPALPLGAEPPPRPPMVPMPFDSTGNIPGCTAGFIIPGAKIPISQVQPQPIMAKPPILAPRPIAIPGSNTVPFLQRPGYGPTSPVQEMMPPSAGFPMRNEREGLLPADSFSGANNLYTLSPLSPPPYDQGLQGNQPFGKMDAISSPPPLTYPVEIATSSTASPMGTSTQNVSPEVLPQSFVNMGTPPGGYFPPGDTMMPQMSPQFNPNLNPESNMEQLQREKESLQQRVQQLERRLSVQQSGELKLPFDPNPLAVPDTTDPLNSLAGTADMLGSFSTHGSVDDIALLFRKRKSVADSEYEALQQGLVDRRNSQMSTWETMKEQSQDTNPPMLPSEARLMYDLDKNPNFPSSSQPANLPELALKGNGSGLHSMDYSPNLNYM
ncbi:hypothetical protein IWQ62_004919 [Dispira parvispora]|uniref:BHLH domain-containing protein n=1 Tax=Dispira parvispora TaxID=1520584 RepID=A0A9W8E5Q2_9FUNG|nr:hypothetical protein IWQ62_004919 [Dispira parvispora]